MEMNQCVCMEGLLTINEAAAFLAVSRSKLYMMMNDGALPSVRLGRSRRIPRLAAIQLAARNMICHANSH